MKLKRGKIVCSNAITTIGMYMQIKNDNMLTTNVN